MALESLWALLVLLLGSPALAGPSASGPSPAGEGSVRAFGPRMDYDEWTPLGRGDPLKNDPTYDYVPPVLERVHYWMEPAKAKEANSRRDHVDPFLKFVDVSGPKGYIQRIANYRGNSLPDVPPTMLVPPPYMPPAPMTSTTPMASTSGLDVEAVNMVHHSSSTTLGWPDGKTQLATLAPAAYSSLNPFHHFEDSPVVPNTFEDKPVSFEDKPPMKVHFEDKLPAGANMVHFEDKPVASNVIGGFGSSQEVPVKTPPRYPPEADNAIHGFRKPANLSEPVMKPSSPSMMSPPQRPPPPPPRSPPREQEVVILDSEGKPAPQDETLASLIKSLLEGEVLPSAPQESAMIAISPMPSMMSVPPAPAPPKIAMSPRPPVPPSTAPTTVSTLTTDPLFSHYKQPATPVSGPRGPPYLIIQGHSKVKTYGASKHGVHGGHGVPVHSHNHIRGDAA